MTVGATANVSLSIPTPSSSRRRPMSPPHSSRRRISRDGSRALARSGAKPPQVGGVSPHPRLKRRRSPISDNWSEEYPRVRWESTRCRLSATFQGHGGPRCRSHLVACWRFTPAGNSAPAWSTPFRHSVETMRSLTLAAHSALGGPNRRVLALERRSIAAGCVTLSPLPWGRSH